MFISEPVIFPSGWNHQGWCDILRSQAYKDAFRNMNRNCRDNGGGATAVGSGTRGSRGSASSEFFILQKPRKGRPPTSWPRPVLPASESVPAGAGRRSSVAQGLAALQHAAEDDLHAGRRAQPADPTVFVLALDVAGLVLVPARAAAGLLLHGGEPPSVREPHPDPRLEPPVGPEKWQEWLLCDPDALLSLSLNFVTRRANKTPCMQKMLR